MYENLYKKYDKTILREWEGGDTTKVPSYYLQNIPDFF
jgi:hypothetical protein